MFKICRSILNITPKGRVWHGTIPESRSISSTSKRFLKSVKEEKQGQVTVISGVNELSSREGKVLPKTVEGSCPICSLRMEIDYTDVLILSQFLRPDGSLLPRRITKVCPSQQKNLLELVRKAQIAGLLSPFRPDLKHVSHKDRPLRSQFKWRRYNVHYHDTIYVEKKLY